MPAEAGLTRSPGSRSFAGSSADDDDDAARSAAATGFVVGCSGASALGFLKFFRSFSGDSVERAGGCRAEWVLKHAATLVRIGFGHRIGENGGGGAEWENEMEVET